METWSYLQALKVMIPVYPLVGCLGRISDVFVPNVNYDYREVSEQIRR